MGKYVIISLLIVLCTLTNIVVSEYRKHAEGDYQEIMRRNIVQEHAEIILGEIARTEKSMSETSNELEKAACQRRIAALHAEFWERYNLINFPHSNLPE